MRFGKTAMAAALAAMAVTAGGCDGPLMMSDGKAEPAQSAQDKVRDDRAMSGEGSAKQGSATADPGSGGDRME